MGDEQSRLRGISGRRTRLKKCPRGSVSGIDYSAVSVEKSRRVNRKAIEAGRCTALQASVESLPFEDGSFDAVTAFETVYFWPEPENSFREALRGMLERAGFSGVRLHTNSRGWLCVTAKNE
mgnify:CR=1 FL=1